MLSSGYDDLTYLEFALLRQRRLKGRPINGSAEIYMLECGNKQAEGVRDKMVEIMDEIEDCELEIVRLEDKENSG